ncbi:vWA domain-containing protein [Frateuria aurantia]
MISMVWPWLALALPLPWIARWLLPRTPPGRSLLLPFPGLQLQSTRMAPARAPLTWLLLSLAWLALVFAAMRPEWVGPPRSERGTGRAMMLAVDISGSMNTDDMRLGGQPVSRFGAVEAIAGDFLQRRDGDELGLLLFGSQAFLVTPLTYDLSAVEQQLRSATVGLAGGQTAIGDAIAVAVKRLAALPQQARVLILLTDGVNNAGSILPEDAARAAKSEGVRIYTIGIGADRMRVDGFFGSQMVNPSADLDVGMLTDIAKQTGGRFFRATDSRELAEAYQTIAQLEPMPQQRPSLRPRHELYPWPLGVSMLLWLLVAAGSQWRAWRSARA